MLQWARADGCRTYQQLADMVHPKSVELNEERRVSANTISAFLRGQHVPDEMLSFRDNRVFLNKLVALIGNAISTIDVCVYVFTSNEVSCSYSCAWSIVHVAVSPHFDSRDLFLIALDWMVATLIHAAADRFITVRVISDSDKQGEQGCQIHSAGKCYKSLFTLGNPCTGVV